MPELKVERMPVAPQDRDKVRDGLEQLRLRLLDLTSRNKLISFRHGTSTIRIVNADLERIYGSLTSGDKIAFQYVPEPTKEEIGERGEKPSPRQYADQLGWSTSFDLLPDQGRTDLLSVLHFKEDFDVLVRKVASTAKTALDESGTNLLHVVFGFLEWRESDDSTQVRHAPLLVVPVRLQTPKAAQEDRSVRVYYDDGDALTANLSLVEKMRRDFGIEMPVLGEEESPASYFARVQAAVEHKRDWRICRQVSLGLLSFAKLLMYLDLDMERWPALGEHERFVEIFASDRTSGMTFASEYELDEEAKRTPIPSLICDADSSQHSALIDATRGKNLVIEGPPGTGKSQTITNLIAAFLAQGKRVLFVAEKMAALDVVKRRLDHAHLGEFCLELHSHKTNKVGLLKSMEQRITAHQGFTEPASLADRKTMLANHRDTLTKYVKLLNQAYGAIEKSPFELIWSRDSLRRHFDIEALQVSSIAFTESHLWSPVEFEKRLDDVVIYQAHLSRYRDAGGEVRKSKNPWSWLPTHDLDLFAQEELPRRLGKLRELCEGHRVLIDAFVRAFNGITEKPEDWLRNTASWKLEIPRLNETANPQLFLPLANARERDFAMAFAEAVESYQGAKSKLFASDRLLDSDLPETIERECEVLKGRGLETFTVDQIRSIVTLLGIANRQSVPAERAVNELGTALGVNAVFSMRCLTELLEGRRLLDVAPLDLLHLRKDQYKAEGLVPKLDQAREQCDQLRAQRSRLSEKFALENELSVGELDSAASFLESTPWYMRWFSPSYRRAKVTFRTICTEAKKVPAAQMAAGLRQVASWKRRVGAFEGQYRHSLTDEFDGLSTDWDSVLRLAMWYEEISVRLPDHQSGAQSISRSLLTLPASRLKGIVNASTSEVPAASDLQELSSTIERLHGQLLLVPFERDSARIDDFLAVANPIAEAGSMLLDTLDSLSPEGTTSERQLCSWVDEARRLRSVREELRTRTEVERSLGGAYQGERSDTGQLKATIEFVAKVHGTQLPIEIKKWLLCREYAERSHFIVGWLGEFEANTQLIASTENEVISLLKQEIPFGKRTSTEALTKAIDGLDLCIQSAALLPMWIDVRRAAERLREGGLQYIIEAVGEQRVSIEHVRHAFEFLFYDSLIRRLFNDNPELWRLNGTSHEETRRKFADLDKAVIELTQLDVAHKASRATVPRGERGKARETTEYALLQHEMAKQRAHIPIRQLLLRAGKAIQALKPCFMMSPMSVAQFLEPGHLHFDLVVMDEASQLRPEDALGAIARASQLVVVGDPKQLPPTSFFQRTLADEDDQEEQTIAAENESILDISLGLYQPVRRLRWHYRSQHHSLIAYSNDAFYDGDLVVFPSAYHDHPDLGVKFVAVQGILHNRRNAVEAERVVDAVLDHIAVHPGESLGVVTMNFDQRELIEELLYARLANDSFASTWIEDREDTAEPFFIKNLENVQGDERDVIFISVTYGKDAQGNMFQRFAGVNSASGHRRLNVMVTRAKKRTVVFSSLDGDDIKVTAATPWGVRALKGYLDYAKKGISAQPEISPGAEPSNQHEAAIGYLLKEQGYDVIPQVGVSGYFIDLAVRHPNKPGAFLLGIEFDGKSYHSGRSARDRDRLRQMTLEKQGWKIHRIWSTDWFKNRDAEVERLLRRVRDLCLVD
jgi:very-short-patch-repair endonuclease